MKKTVFLAAAAVALASCSSDELVNNSAVNEAPIAFNVGQKNITRADVVSNKLEDNGYLNFGVWANKYKAADSKTGESVMVHYLVGFNDASKGYAKSEATTGTWFYEGLGNDDSYIGTAPYVTSSTSVREHQYLRYWDLSYNNTKFFAYAPYDKDVTFTEGTDGSKIITVPASVNKAGTEHDVIYAGTKAINASNYDKTVSLQFKHLGAKVNLKFYEDIPGYSVELLEVTENENDIKATPAKLEGTTYDEDAKYFSKSEATIVYDDNMVATATASTTGTPDANAALVFKLPTDKSVPQAVATGNTQTYLESPTTYYAVAQPTNSTTGFLIHVSFKLTAEDAGKEEIIVRDAQVFVPASQTDGANTTYIAAWQPNTKYTYTFKITKDTNLYPIVFDNITIDDYENEGKN